MASRINHGKQNWQFDGSEWHCSYKGKDYADIFPCAHDDQWRGRLHFLGHPEGLLLTGLAEGMAPGVALAVVQGMIKGRLDYARNLSMSYWPYISTTHTHRILHYSGTQAGCVQPAKPGQSNGPWEITFHPLGINTQPLPVSDNSQEHIYAQALGVILRRANELEAILLG